MKTFVTDDYQITLDDNCGFTVRIEKYFDNTRITYNTDSNRPWKKLGVDKWKKSVQCIR